GTDAGEIALGVQLPGLAPPARGRARPPVAGHVEGHQPPVPAELRVRHQGMPLPRIGARRMQQEHDRLGGVAGGLLEDPAVVALGPVDAQVARLDPVECHGRGVVRRSERRLRAVRIRGHRPAGHVAHRLDELFQEGERLRDRERLAAQLEAAAGAQRRAHRLAPRRRQRGQHLPPDVRWRVGAYCRGRPGMLDDRNLFPVGHQHQAVGQPAGQPGDRRLGQRRGGEPVHPCPGAHRIPVPGFDNMAHSLHISNRVWQSDNTTRPPDDTHPTPGGMTMSSDRKCISSRPVDSTRRGLVAAAGVATVAAGFPAIVRAQPKEVNGGVIMPLSGANAQFGINSRNGIELVADEINEAGGIQGLGGAKIKLIVADGTSTPTTAANVAQRMISQNQVTAILGAFASSLTIAISEVTERRGIPLLTMSFADQITGRGFKNIFQVVSKASTIGRAQFDDTLAIAKAAGETVSKAAIMYEDTAYGTAQAKGLREAAKAAGVEVVMDDAYPLGITDVTPLITKLRNSGAQMVFPVSYLNDSLLIIRTMRQQQID